LNQQFPHRQFSNRNPLANVLVVIVGIIIIALSLALGFVVFLIIGGFMLVMAVVVGVRTWWMTKRFGSRKQGAKSQRADSSGQTRVIEGEFHEVESDDSGERRR